MTGKAVASHHQVRWTAGAIIWLVCLTGMALFQAWRGAYPDALVFGALVVVLTLDRSLGDRLPRLGLRWRQSIRATSALLLMAGVALILIPRHEVFAMLVMMCVGVGMVFAAWPSPSGDVRKLSKLGRRSSWIWGSIAGAFVLWEGLTFVLSVTLPGGSEAHPTLSVLLDPGLSLLAGKILFVAVWIGVGLGVLSVWRKA